ncbi:MAG: hypothetical protein SNJ33_07315 [Rikenellaceae bacterium]
MIIFRLRMVSDENDNFVRDYLLEAQTSLVELHNFIIESLDYEECISSIFSSNDEWEREVEYTLIDMGAEQSVPMDGVRVCDLLRKEGDRMIYLYDAFENRGYYITLLEMMHGDGGEYPRESFAHGTPSDQYDADAVNNDGSIFDEMMDEFGDMEDDEYYQDEY